MVKTEQRTRNRTRSAAGTFSGHRERSPRICHHTHRERVVHLCCCCEAIAKATRASDPGTGRPARSRRMGATIPAIVAAMPDAASWPRAAASARDALTALGLLATPLSSRTTPADSWVSETLLLVPGAGYATVAQECGELVPSGLWSTELFAREVGLESGSMVSYVSWALSIGVRPIVLREHSAEAVAGALASLESDVHASGRSLHVVIAAHSEGGAGTVRALGDHAGWVGTVGTSQAVAKAGLRVVGVALLDSVHSSKDMPSEGSAVEAFLRSGAAVNWVVSSAPLDDSKPKPWVRGGFLGGVLARSAGGTNHLAVPSTARKSACHFLGQRLYASRDAG